MKRWDLLLALASSSLEICCLINRPDPICPFDSDYQNEKSIFTIDIQAHVFNATDLQVRESIRRITANQDDAVGLLADFFGGALESFAWAAAPGANSELDELQRLKLDFICCDIERHIETLKELQQDRYEAGVKELRT